MLPDIKSIEACFCHDNGSLPELELIFREPQEMPKVYAYLISRSMVTTPEATFWDTARQCDTAVASVPNAAEWVVEGKAEGFQLRVAGLQVSGTELPELGIAVYPECFGLDWRMGPAWSEQKIIAFFELLHQLGTVAPSLQLEDASIGELPCPEAFFAFQRAYEAESSQKGEPR